MVRGLVGVKRGMTQLFAQDGRVLPVTVIEAGPCHVVCIRTSERDGYEAVQLAFQEVPERKVTKPVLGQFRRVALPPARWLREVAGDPEGVQVGQVIGVEIFKQGERVAVTGVSRGKGFAGVMKRHGFHGGPASHGSMSHRLPGSIGSSSFPSRVFKGMRMAGHMGHRQVTVKGLEMVEVRREEGLLFVKGAVPGPPGTLVVVTKKQVD